MKKTLISLSIVGCATAVLFTALMAQAPQAKVNAPVVGKPVPAFTMTDLKGKVHTNRSLRGKVVLLDFWATWCGPCKAASPSMQKFHEKYAKQGLVVVGANTWEQKKGTGPAADYAKEHKYTYTFTTNNDKLAESWGIRGIPHFVLIGRNGNVLRVDTGFAPQTEAAMEKAIKTALAAK